MISWRDCADPWLPHEPTALSEPAAQCLGVHKSTPRTGRSIRPEHKYPIHTAGCVFHDNYFMQASGQNQDERWLIRNALPLPGRSPPTRLFVQRLYENWRKGTDTTD